MTFQGYICIVFDSSFSILNDRGDFIFEDLPKQSYYSSVRVFGYNYLFLPDEHTTSRFENEIHSEPLFDLTEIYQKGDYNKSEPSVYLSKMFEDEGAVLLRGTGKWMIYNSSHTMQSSHLFDEVLPSDESDLLLVRKEMDWFCYFERYDSLIPLRCRYIHPRGLVEGLFFGSNDRQDFEEKKWSLNKLEFKSGEINLNLSNAEVYQFPPEYYNNRKDLKYPWQIFEIEQKKWLPLIKENKTVWINQKGEEVYTEPTANETHIKLADLFMPSFIFNVKDLKPIENKKQFERNTFGLYLFEDGQHIEIAFANTTKDTQKVTINNKHLSVILEYEKAPGQWQEFSKSPDDAIFSDFSQKKDVLPNHVFSKKVWITSGAADKKYKVRAKYLKDEWRLEYIYSEPIELSLCPAMLYGSIYSEVMNYR